MAMLDLLKADRSGRMSSRHDGAWPSLASNADSFPHNVNVASFFNLGQSRRTQVPGTRNRWDR